MLLPKLSFGRTVKNTPSRKNRIGSQFVALNKATVADPSHIGQQPRHKDKGFELVKVVSAPGPIILLGIGLKVVKSRGRSLYVIRSAYPLPRDSLERRIRKGTTFVVPDELRAPHIGGALSDKERLKSLVTNATLGRRSPNLFTFRLLTLRITLRLSARAREKAVLTSVTLY